MPTSRDNYLICVPVFSRMQWWKVVIWLVNKYEVEKIHKTNTTKFLFKNVPQLEQSGFLEYQLHVGEIVLYFFKHF